MSLRCVTVLSSLLVTACLTGCDRAPDATVPPPAAVPQAVSEPAGPEPSLAADSPPAETPLLAAPEPLAPPVPEPQAIDDDPPALAALRKGMPADVSDFIRRAVVCNHWAGEEPYDEDRRAQIAAAVGSLRCRELDADQASLRAAYAGNPEVLRRLSQSRRTPL